MGKRLPVAMCVIACAASSVAHARPGDVDAPLAVPGFPFIHAASTVGHAGVIARYGCAPTIVQGGPEVAYAVTLDRPGELVASISGAMGVVDVDVHIVASLRTDRDGVANACLARANTVAQATLQSGAYFVVVDTVDNAARAGPYTLRIDFQPQDAWYERALARGVSLRTRRYANLNGNVQFTGVLIVDPRESGVIVRPVTTERCTPLPALGGAAGAVAAVNGGLFDETTCAPQSFVKIDGAVEARGDAVARTAFGVDAAGAGVVRLVPTDDVFAGATHALGGLPRIVTAGAVDLHTIDEGGSLLFEQMFDARTVAGNTDAGDIVFATVDGRTSASAGVPLPVLAQWLLGLGIGLRDAVNLDGGQSTTLWARGEPHDGIVNYPTRGRANHLNARPIQSAWLVFGAPLERPPLFLTSPPPGPARSGEPYVYEAVAADPAGAALRLGADATMLAGDLSIEDRGDGTARYAYVPSTFDVTRSPITLSFFAEVPGGLRASQSVAVEVVRGAADGGVVSPDGGNEDGGNEDAGVVEGGTNDSGVADAGIVDGGVGADASATDAGMARDAGTAAGGDGGRTDAGVVASRMSGGCNAAARERGWEVALVAAMFASWARKRRRGARRRTCNR